MHAFNNKTTFAPMYLSLLELDTHCFRLDFKLRDENLNYLKDIPSLAIK